MVVPFPAFVVYQVPASVVAVWMSAELVQPNSVLPTAIECPSFGSFDGL